MHVSPVGGYRSALEERSFHHKQIPSADNLLHH